MPRVHASIVVIGDEILGGFVQDTNSGWLAGRLRVLGIPLDRVVTVPDDVETIATALRDELDRGRPRVVFTSGGIGSTPDDLTMASVARCLDVPTVLAPAIDTLIEQAVAWHARHGLPLSEAHRRAMRRMAYVPEGAYLLDGARGVVPGVGVDVDGGIAADAGATIVVLPGVPEELRRIVAEGVEPTLLAGRGAPGHVVELTHDYPESMLSPVLGALVEAHPDVHVGSYPGAPCLVRLIGPRESVEAAASAVRDELDRLDATAGSAELKSAWAQRWGGTDG